MLKTGSYRHGINEDTNITCKRVVRNDFTVVRPGSEKGAVKDIAIKLVNRLRMTLAS